MTIFTINPSKSINGTIKVPGDKSISHRSIIFGAIAKGTTKISNFLEGEDTLSTLKAFQNMGVEIERDGAKVTIKGVGKNGLKQPNDVLDLGNSGTSMRLMSGLLAAQNFDSTLIGDVSLNKRPMNRVIKPLEKMGAKIDSNEGKPPLKIKGTPKLSGINYEMPIASAQVKSCLLLAGLYANGTTTVTENAPTRNHTERMLKGFGYEVSVNKNVISLKGGGELNACDIQVPSDISSAAFFMVAGSIAKNSEITLKSVNINPTRTGVIDILKLMGANITLKNEQEIAGELVADIIVKSANLKGIDIPENLVPLAIDEFPVIFIAAVAAQGKTKLTGARELRVKESDRIQVMADGLKIVGIDCEVLEDGIIIEGGEVQAPSQNIKSHQDHRISMAFSMLGFISNHTITIEGCENVQTSFPNFVDLASGVGLDIRII
jgi:3-phosphoshikimate 1-carboxyvinyltransferase